jgi:hypothetical protein
MKTLTGIMVLFVTGLAFAGGPTTRPTTQPTSKPDFASVRDLAAEVQKQAVEWNRTRTIVGAYEKTIKAFAGKTVLLEAIITDVDTQNGSGILLITEALLGKIDNRPHHLKIEINAHTVFKTGSDINADKKALIGTKYSHLVRITMVGIVGSGLNSALRVDEMP